MILKIKINYYYHYEKMAGYWIFSSIETLILIIGILGIS
jgi:hypothetical protein